jgi:serine/arginine repetitive matrix protein 2
MSYNNIGLGSARGTGTNGYVARNIASSSSSKRTSKIVEAKRRTPNSDILEHKRKRAKLAALMELEERLRAQGQGDEEIQEALKEYMMSGAEVPLLDKDSHQKSVDKAAAMHKLGKALAINTSKQDGKTSTQQG